MKHLVSSCFNRDWFYILNVNKASLIWSDMRCSTRIENVVMFFSLFDNMVIIVDF